MKPYRWMTTATLLLGALATPLAAATPAPVPPGTVQSYDAYKSWLIACDNALSCVAKGFSQSDQGAEIDVERAAGAAGKLALTIRASRTFTLADLKIDGKPARLGGAAWQLDASPDGTTLSSNDLPAIRGLVARLRNATRVTLGGDAAVPLDGFAAAILRMDDRQGRVGGATALVKTGPLPASRVPGPPALPRIPHHPVTATLAAGEDKRLIAAVRADQTAVFAKEGCEADVASASEAYALDAKLALVLIPCIMGAYQGSSLGYIAPRNGGPPKRLILPSPYLGNDPDRSDQSYLTEAAFDAPTATLSMAAKGRGMADCGFSASWIWSGARFMLSEMALQQMCGGVEPGDWPTLFRSRR